MKYDYGLKPLKFWCQKVLPLVYDESLSYEELLCKVVFYLNNVINDVKDLPEYIKELVSEEELKDLLSELLDELREQIASINEHDNTNASADRTVGELVWLNDKLARIVRAMYSGDRYVEETGESGVTGNFVYTTVEIEINNLKNSLTTALNNEATARENADTALGTRIDNEVTARTNADTALGTRIDNETTARESADSSLGTRIDNEATARESADSSLGTRIDNEATARANADTELANDILNSKKRKVLLIGDSYMRGDHATTDTIESTLIDLMKCITYNKSVGGTGFISESNNFASQILSAHNDSNIPDDEITDVLIAGGYNDSLSATQSDFTTAVHNCVENCRTYFQNARVWIAPLLWSNGAFPNYSWAQKHQYMLNACKGENVNVFSDAPCILYRTTGTMYTDGIHPNSNGYKLLGEALGRFMCGADGSPMYQGAEGINVGGLTGNYAWFIKRGRVHLYISGNSSSQSFDAVLTPASSMPDVIVPAGTVPGVVCQRGVSPSIQNACVRMTSNGLVAPSGMTADNELRMEFVYDFYPYIYT